MRTEQTKFMSLMNGTGNLIVNSTAYSCCTRFRMVPAFGDEIRRFEGNVSDMKRLAGHDLEDILQVC